MPTFDLWTMLATFALGLYFTQKKTFGKLPLY
jgi:hypothetical protein